MPTVTVRTKEGVEKFGRAGLRFTREPTTLEVSDEQLAALQAESMLEVSGARAAASVPAPSDEDEHAEKRRGARK